MAEAAGSTGQGNASTGQAGSGGGESTSVNTGQVATKSGEATSNTETKAEVKAETTTPETTQEIQLHKLQQKLKDKYKDKKFEKESDYLDAADSELSELEGYRTENIKRNERLFELFEAHPELADIIQDMDKGSSFTEAFARNVDVDAIKPFEGEPDYDAWSKAKEDRKKKLDERKKFQTEYDANVQNSVKFYSEWAKKQNFTPEKSNEFTGKIDGVLAEASKGVISEAFLNLMKKGLSFDEAVQEAAVTGEIKGKNEQIEVIKEKETKKGGDGIPNLQSTGEAEPNKKQKQDDIFSTALNRQLNREKKAYGLK